MKSPNDRPWRVQVFFDGDCPLCRREIRMLRRMDRRRWILFTDITDPTFEPDAYGVSRERLMAEIQGRLPAGSWISGVEVFRQLYAAVGFGPLVALSRLPGISGALDLGYRLFARNRLKWTGRCLPNSDTCSADSSQVVASGATEE